MEYPVILQISERHQDDWFYICNNPTELKQASLDAFKVLEGRIYEEEPQKDRYPEVTQEYIENAPKPVQQDLRDIKEKRERWLAETGWTGTYRQAKHFYELYQSAKNGDGKSALRYLEHYAYARTHRPTTI